jgi:L-cystine transport system ATP-binding protein
MPALEVKGLFKSYGKTPVLRGIDLSVAAGEVVTLLGSSGSGKTTLLRCLNFLEKADAGTLAIAGQCVKLKHAKRREILELRRKTAMVFQHYELFLNKTALENIMEGLVTARKVPKEEARERALAALGQVALADRADARPFELSGGQQQRVGIARALALEPEVLLLDEPTSALDPETISEVQALVASIAQSGQTMLIVTHDMDFAYRLASRVAFMDGGEILEQGPPKEFFSNPKNERTREFLARFTASVVPEYFL